MELTRWAKLAWPFRDDLGLRMWFVTFLIIAPAAIICWAIWFWALRNSNACMPPNHLVWTGTHLQLIGKILVRVNDYECVGP